MSRPAESVTIGGRAAHILLGFCELALQPAEAFPINLFSGAKPRSIRLRITASPDEGPEHRAASGWSPSTLGGPKQLSEVRGSTSCSRPSHSRCCTHEAWDNNWPSYPRACRDDSQGMKRMRELSTPTPGSAPRSRTICAASHFPFRFQARSNAEYYDMKAADSLQVRIWGDLLISAALLDALSASREAGALEKRLAFLGDSLDH